MYMHICTYVYFNIPTVVGYRRLPTATVKYSVCFLWIQCIIICYSTMCHIVSLIDEGLSLLEIVYEL